MKTQQVFDAITTIIGNYNEKATQAVKVGDGKLYVPGYMSLEDFIRLVADPSVLIQTGGNAKEPAYLSVEEGLRGCNTDGSKHSGFIMIDVIAREVVAIVDREGNKSFDANDSSKEVMEGRWGGYRIDATNSKGEHFEIETLDGVRGMNIPVTVIVDGGKWNVIHEDRPLAIKGVKRVARVS